MEHTSLGLNSHLLLNCSSVSPLKYVFKHSSKHCIVFALKQQCSLTSTLFDAMEIITSPQLISNITN